MNQTNSNPKIVLEKTPEYRESYANSVQIRMSVWDFFLAFGVAHQEVPETVTILHNEGIYLSPQQAKALFNVLGQNLAQYEQAFGPIALEPHAPIVPTSPIH